MAVVNGDLGDFYGDKELLMNGFEWLQLVISIGI